MKKIAILLLSFFAIISCQRNNQLSVSSPDGNATISFQCDDQLQYAVTFHDDTVIALSAIDILPLGYDEFNGFSILGSEQSLLNDTWERTWGKDRQVVNHANQLTIHLKHAETGTLLDLVARAYDDGVAFRYGFPKQDGMETLELSDEHTEFHFTADHTAWMTSYDNFKNSQEMEFPEVKLSGYPEGRIIGLPLLVQASENSYCVITEAALTDWSGFFLRPDTTKAFTFETTLPPWPDEPGLAVKRNIPAFSPWRVIMLATNPGRLIESDLIANLNEPVAIDDVSWIEPGVSAWDWWWCNSYAPSAGFKLGPNQQTMKYFIDFASEMGWEYQIVDWQWYGEPFLQDTPESYIPNPDVDITTCIDGINIEKLVQYAASKNVKLVIWLQWWHLQRQIDEAFPLYEKWGVAGVKIDFMDRQDQEMVNFYHEVARKAAQHHLVVDFHGAYRPTGVSRTWPNLITREGVLGNEYNKWSTRITPEHTVTLPFTRGLLGEMDFTPVGFRNTTPQTFRVETETEDGSPRVMTTRCQQLAMTVVYESAFGVFCDSPDNYRKGIGLEFLSIVPTTWDETKVVNAAVADYITVARRSGDAWFVGSMTDGTARDLEIRLDFLGEGTYTATIWEDADDAATNPMHAVKRTIEVTSTDIINASLAPGGGQVIHLEKSE